MLVDTERRTVTDAPPGETELLIEEVRRRTRRRRRRYGAVAAVIAAGGAIGGSLTSVNSGAGTPSAPWTIPAPKPDVVSPAPTLNEITSVLITSSNGYGSVVQSRSQFEISLRGQEPVIDSWEPPRTDPSGALTLSSVQIGNSRWIPNPYQSTRVCWYGRGCAVTSRPWIEVSGMSTQTIGAASEITIENVAGPQAEASVRDIGFASRQNLDATDLVNSHEFIPQLRAWIPDLSVGAANAGTRLTSYSGVRTTAFAVPPATPQGLATLYTLWLMQAGTHNPGGGLVSQSVSARIVVTVDQHGVIRSVTTRDITTNHEVSPGGVPAQSAPYSPLPAVHTVTASNFNQLRSVRPPSDEVFVVPTR